MENKYKLLSAEDDTALRDIAALFFRKNGFDVDTAINGDEACELPHLSVFSLIKRVFRDALEKISERCPIFC